MGQQPALATWRSAIVERREPSPRQREILYLLGLGFSHTEIAAQLYLSRATITKQLQRLRDAAQLCSVDQLLIVAGERGWARRTAELPHRV